MRVAVLGATGAASPRARYRAPRSRPPNSTNSPNQVAVSIGDDELHVQDWLIQPVAADTVADVLSEAACSSARPSTRTVTGPEVIRLPELTSRLLEHHGDHRPVRTTTPPLPGFSDGQLVAPGDAAVVGPDVDAWLQTASAHNTWLKTI